MTPRARRLLAPLLMVTLLALGLAGLRSAGAAATIPSYEPPTANSGSVGTVTMFNASGAQITSGSIDDSPLAVYYKASGPKIPGFTNNFGFVAYATPQDGALPPSWTTVESWTSAQNFTTAQAAYPPGLNDPATVVIKGAAADGPFATHITNFPSASVANPGVYQIRMFTSAANAATYYTADIKVDAVTRTWTQVYPAVSVVAPTSTSTLLNVTPAGPVDVGQQVTLSAAVTPVSAVGKVQFFDGATALGAPVTLTAGSASTSTVALNAGAHSLTAVFVPDTAVFAGSTSPAVPVTVNAVPVTATTTELVVTPVGPVLSGTAVSFVANLTPPTATGTVQFYDGAATLGAAAPVVAGQAVTQTSSLSVGSHNLKATFVPGSAAFGASSSAVSVLAVTQAPAVTTSIGVVLSPTGPVTHGTAVTLKATVLPTSAVGTVRFTSDGTLLGQANLIGGTAEIQVSTLAVGTHSIGAAFLPTVVANFLGSTATPVSLVVDAPPPGATTTTLTLSPKGPVGQGTAVVVDAAVGPAGASGTVQFFDQGAVALGPAVSLTKGHAVTTLTSLAVGTHALSARFDPTGAGFLGSMSGAVEFIVTTPTTSAIAVVPPGPVPFGLDVNVTGTVTPNDAPGTMQVLDGTAVVGSASVTAGQADVSVSGLRSGAHSLRVRFTPADLRVYAGSTSSAVTVVVSPPPAVVTTTALTESPTPVSAGTVVRFRATVSPASAVGAVRFTEGGRRLGTVALAGGRATFATRTLPRGTHVVVATFVPTSSLVYRASMSPPVQVVVTAPAAVTVTDGSGQPYAVGATIKPSTSLVVTGEGYAAGELVTVTVHSTPTVLSQVSADSAGGVTTTVTLPSTLSAGTHVITVSSRSATVSYTFRVASVSSGTSGTVADNASSGSSASSSSSSGTSSLAHTGSDVGPVAFLGLLLVGAGAVLVLSARRRRGVQP